jgi:transposase
LRTRRVCEIVEGRGCELLYLQPCSPELNPIAEAFAKLCFDWSLSISHSSLNAVAFYLLRFG